MLMMKEMCFPGLLQDHRWGETLVPQLREKGVRSFVIIGAAQSYVVTERVKNTIINHQMPGQSYHT